MTFDPFNELAGGSALRLDEGQQDDYCLPVASHSPETERLDFVHDIYKYTAGNIPDEVMELLSDGQDRSILDVGCDTGKWAVEMTEAFPNVHVIGVDLAHPPITVFPPNFHFEIHDVTKGQEYANDTFDIVHVRDITPGISDFHGMLEECVRVLRPGGHLLVKEIEWMPYLHGGGDPRERMPAFRDSAFRSALSERSIDPMIGINLKRYVGNVRGLCDIQYSRHMVPLSPWSDDPILNYTGHLTRIGMPILGNTMRVMLIDHGHPDPDSTYAEAMRELSDLTIKPAWYFGNVAARKQGKFTDVEAENGTRILANG
ncbi:uncharacterized protein L201_007248 [Kwoniella dendrophila CBS 6074]|uniref:Methyltransferase domain-containing protein n=1 Tax=Kwoniella dendrophila CBS 6074 TaxID=1295534 RepID=A0AAX4K4H1_9TREE